MQAFVDSMGMCSMLVDNTTLNTFNTSKTNTTFNFFNTSGTLNNLSCSGTSDTLESFNFSKAADIRNFSNTLNTLDTLNTSSMLRALRAMQVVVVLDIYVLVVLMAACLLVCLWLTSRYFALQRQICECQDIVATMKLDMADFARQTLSLLHVHSVAGAPHVKHKHAASKSLPVIQHEQEQSKPFVAEAFRVIDKCGAYMFPDVWPRTLAQT